MRSCAAWTGSPRERPSQLSRADLRELRPEQINAAHRAGQLSDLLASRCLATTEPGPDRGSDPGQLTRADLADMTSNQINAARKAGRLTSVGVAAG